MAAVPLLRRLAGNRYLLSLGAGYAQMSVMILVSLLQVPLALAYLGKSQFGIWALASQVAVWFQLVDGGMNGALSRHLIDYRKDGASADLGKCLATGLRVLCLQGLVVLAIGIGLGMGGSFIFHLSPADSAEFRAVMWVLGSSAGLMFAGKVAQSWLYACQRLDLANLIGLGLALLEFALLWLLLRGGLGLMALAWARLAMVLVGVLVCWWVAVRWAELPWHLLFGAWDTGMLRKLATFGGGMFLLTTGSLLLTMSQSAIASRFLGVTAAAVWATAPKVFVLAQQLVAKLWDYRIPHLSALMSEGRTREITEGFVRVFGITAWTGGILCGLLAAINPSFLALWTAGRIHWAAHNDLLMALAVYALLLVRCIPDLLLHTKKVGWMPALMCVEGALFVALAAHLMPRWGLTGMICASLLISGVLRVPYAWRALRSYLGSDAPAGIRLLAPAFGGLASGTVLWGLLTLVTRWSWLDSPQLVLLGQGALVAVLLGPVLPWACRTLRNA